MSELQASSIIWVADSLKCQVMFGPLMEAKPLRFVKIGIKYDKFRLQAFGKRISHGQIVPINLNGLMISHWTLRMTKSNSKLVREPAAKSKIKQINIHELIYNFSVPSQTTSRSGKMTAWSIAKNGDDKNKTQMIRVIFFSSGSSQ